MKATLIAFAAAASAASAATVVYTDQASFQSQVGGGVGLSNFNALASTAGSMPLPSVSGSFNDFAYEISLSVSSSNPNLGIGVLSDAGSTDRYLVGLSSISGIRVDFTGLDPVTAVGGNFFRWNQSTGQSTGGGVSVYLYAADGSVIHADPFSSAGASTFRAYTTDAAIDHMIIRYSGAFIGQYAAMDNLSFGAAVVPLPPAAWAGLGLLGAVGLRRAVRRR